jgi:predicted nucleic acid-binding protein
MMNALAVAVRRKRIEPEQAVSFLSLLSNFDFHIAVGPDIIDLPRLSALASRYQLTAYDTAYLDLAKQNALPLATLDDDLQKPALAEGIEILQASRELFFFSPCSPVLLGEKDGPQ